MAGILGSLAAAIALCILGEATSLQHIWEVLEHEQLNTPSEFHGRRKAAVDSLRLSWNSLAPPEF